ncbi:DUF4367 domain-containing protein [Sedimentibacter sp.]|uniref:DUF4367 domain-containing protein n=1 Tax=Sedimentibacter sp. TaxID=1960295 RepID=UPI0028A9E2C6|nr:DUF4367 domain-containing protein [Sedimentibacter sp.]
MKKDTNSIDKTLGKENDQHLHKVLEDKFNEDMEMFDTFMKDEEEIPGLSDFDKRMHNNINEMYRDGKRQRRNKMIFKTIAASAAIILLSFIFYPPMFGKVNAFFFRMMNLTSIDKGEYTEFRMKPRENQQIEEFDGYYYPRYIPDSYEIIVKNNMEVMGTIIYLNKNDNTKILYSFSNLNSPEQLDTENCNKEDILINNQLGLLYTKKDNSRNLIVFQNDEYKFVVSGNVDVDTLKEIAKSIKK